MRGAGGCAARAYSSPDDHAAGADARARLRYGRVEAGAARGSETPSGVRAVLRKSAFATRNLATSGQLFLRPSRARRRGAVASRAPLPESGGKITSEKKQLVFRIGLHGVGARGDRARPRWRSGPGAGARAGGEAAGKKSRAGVDSKKNRD